MFHIQAFSNFFLYTCIPCFRAVGFTASSGLRANGEVERRSAQRLSEVKTSPDGTSPWREGRRVIVLARTNKHNVSVCVRRRERVVLLLSSPFVRYSVLRFGDKEKEVFWIKKSRT